MARATLALWRSRWSTIVSMTTCGFCEVLARVEVDQRLPVREHARQDREVLADDLEVGEQAVHQVSEHRVDRRHAPTSVAAFTYLS